MVLEYALGRIKKKNLLRRSLVGRGETPDSIHRKTVTGGERFGPPQRQEVVREIENTKKLTWGKKSRSTLRILRKEKQFNKPGGSSAGRRESGRHRSREQRESHI